MSKREDDTAIDEPTTEASVSLTKESKASEKTAAAPTVEASVPVTDESKAADTKTAPAPTVVAPRIRGLGEDKPTESDDVDEADEIDEVDEADGDDESTEGRSTDWSRVLAFGVLPVLALLLALGAGYLKYVDNSVRNSNIAAIESVQAAKDGTVALLSYKPDTVEKQLTDARTLLTGEFEKSYTDLTTNVVIPGAKQQQISASARVPAAASVSADLNHAVVLVYVNQTVVVGGSAPTDTASSVEVTLDKAGDKWLISKFEPK